MSPRKPSPAEPQLTRPRHPLRTCGLLLLVSLALRLALWWPVAGSGMSPMYDEGAYLTRAVGYGNVLRAWASWSQPAETDLIWAYRDGGWPPLHPLLIGVAFALCGPSVGLARLVVAVQSALTTCVVYGLTRRLSDDRSALFAALLHIVYPSFIAFSHLIWSETTCMLMCLGTLYCIVRAADQERLRRQVIWILPAGVLLGLANLARAAALPLFVALPLWLVLRLRQRPARLLLPLVLLGAGAVTILPWEATLWAREKQFKLLTTKSGYYLYEGNNPWTAEDRAKHKMRAALEEHMRAHSVDRDDAGRALALEHIRNDVGGFVRRGVHRLRALFVPDWYILRHAIYAAYPVLPVAVVFALLASLVVGFVLVSTCILYGLCFGRSGFRYRSLLVACVLLVMAPSFLTLAFSRLTLPLLALLLPAAGVGLARLVERRAWGRGLIAFAVVFAGLWLLNPRMPHGAFGTRNLASSYYTPVLRCLEKVFGARNITVKDRVLLRCGAGGDCGPVQVSILNEAYVFQDSGTRELTWTDQRPGDMTRLEITAPHVTAGPPTIRLALPAASQTVTIQPVQPEAWRHWLPSGVGDIEYMWLGSAGIPDEQVALLLQKRRPSGPPLSEP